MIDLNMYFGTGALNIALESWAILVAVIFAIAVKLSWRLEDGHQKYLYRISVFSVLTTFSNLVGLLLKGTPGMPARVILYISNFCEFGFGYVLSGLLPLFMIYCVEEDTQTLAGKRVSPKKTPIYVGLGIALSLLCVSQFTGIYYIIDENNIYQRGPLFWLSQVVALVYMAMTLVYLMKYGKYLQKKVRLAFIIYLVLPSIVLVVQIFFYGIYLLLMAIMISIMMMFILMMMAQQQKFIEQNRELTGAKVALMISQIRPHFVYNALTTIASLCTEDPEEAQRTTVMFADYLRKNMDDMQRYEEMAFEKELTHLKTYLYIEKARFEDLLNIEYDIETTDFKIPTLTLQPLVENAVKHGVGKKSAGGTVRISTRRLNNCTQITVEDDGVGFDPDTKLSDTERSHIGLENVAERLELISNARMTIMSTIGKGTTVTILIPDKSDFERRNSGESDDNREGRHLW